MPASKHTCNGGCDWHSNDFIVDSYPVAITVKHIKPNHKPWSNLN